MEVEVVQTASYQYLDLANLPRSCRIGLGSGISREGLPWEVSRWPQHTSRSKHSPTETDQSTVELDRLPNPWILYKR